jgi:hypothetical protein
MVDTVCLQSRQYIMPPLTSSYNFLCLARWKTVESFSLNRFLGMSTFNWKQSPWFAVNMRPILYSYHVHHSLIQEGMCTLSSHMQYIVFHPVVSSQALPLFVLFVVMLIFYVKFVLVMAFVIIVHIIICGGCFFIFIGVDLYITVFYTAYQSPTDQF